MAAATLVVEEIESTDHPYFTVRVTHQQDAPMLANGHPEWLRVEVFEVDHLIDDERRCYEKIGSDAMTVDLDEAVMVAWANLNHDGRIAYMIGNNPEPLYASSPAGVVSLLEAVLVGIGLAQTLITNR